MEKTETRRQFILEKIADYVIEHGIKESSIRPLAAAAGISDRMLLYYFENKEEVLTAALNLIAARMINLLESARSAPMPYQTLMPHLARMLKDNQVRPYLRLWLELAALSASGHELYGQMARQIGELFYAWLVTELQVEREESRASMAALAFVTIEGFVFIDAIGGDAIVQEALEAISMDSSQ